MFGFLKKKCNHQGLMYPVLDRNGWMVGWLCDCGHFDFRKDMPQYEERLKREIELSEKLARLILNDKQGEALSILTQYIMDKFKEGNHDEIFEYRGSEQKQ